MTPEELGFADAKIKTKKRQIVSFAPNAMQERYLDDLLPAWRDGDLKMRRMREYILKARQFGFSTLIAVLFFLDTISTPGTGTAVVSYDKKSTEKLFQMVDRMYRALPDNLRPRTQRANTHELYWPDIDCHYEVLTAGSNSLGRGWTINNLHCSEFAFWTNPDLIGELLQAVPDDGNVFVESTANGEGTLEVVDGDDVITGNAYHAYYCKYRSEGDAAEYRVRFFAWFENPEYRTDPPEDFVRTTAEDEEAQPRIFERYGNEMRLAELYGLDDAQLYWRRRKINSPGMGPAKFCQEYPANDVEAFRTSGKKFFAGLWDVDVHVQELEIQPWWTPIGGFDWGYGAPYAFGLGWIFPLRDGRVGFYVSDELYGARVRNTDQAKAILDLLQRRAINVHDIEVFADPATWSKEGSHQASNIGRANVEDYHDVSLRFVKANNDRPAGCSNMREYMAARGALFISPRCVNLIRQLSQVLHDPHDIEVYESSKQAEQHAVDMLRYMLNTRPWAPDEPGPETVVLYKGLPIKPLRQLPAELQTDVEAGYDEYN